MAEHGQQQRRAEALDRRRLPELREACDEVRRPLDVGELRQDLCGGFRTTMLPLSSRSDFREISTAGCVTV